MAHRRTGDTGFQVEYHGWLGAEESVLHQLSDHLQVCLRILVLGEERRVIASTGISMAGKEGVSVCDGYPLTSLWSLRGDTVRKKVGCLEKVQVTRRPSSSTSSRHTTS